MKTKIIGIDGNEANIVNRVGVNVYAFEILKNIALLQDEWSDKIRFVVYLKEKPLEDLPKETKFWKYEVLDSSGPLWIVTKLMPYLFLTKEKPDVLFSPSHYTVPIALLPRVIAIMDLGYLKISGQFEKLAFWQLKYWSAISIIISKHIIAISNATKKDIVRQYPAASKKVAVTHLAFDKEKYNTNVSNNDVRRIKEKYAIVDDYILYIGTLKPSKNVEGVINAFAKIANNNTIKLVIAGKKGWMYESIFNLINKLKIEQRVIFTDYFLEEDKPAIIKGAKVLVSPSFTEGFGLHVLEAMACGTPVVVSNIDSMPEIVGNAGIQVDPYDNVSIAEGLKKVLNMPEKRYNELVESGINQAKKFSWQDTARKTIRILEEAKK